MFVVHVSLHGLLRSSEPELGHDEDTGGQILYVLELAKALCRHAEIKRVDVVTRLVVDERAGPSYARPREPFCGKGAIVRLPFGTGEYLPKEALWRHIDEASEVLRKFLLAQPVLPHWLHAHYADAGAVCLQLSKELGIPMVFTSHSLGLVKLQAAASSPICLHESFPQRVAAEEACLAWSSMVVASSEDEVKEQYSLYRNRARRCTVIAPGLNTEELSVRGAAPLPEAVAAAGLDEVQATPILTVSRLDPRKNLAVLVRAFAAGPPLRCNLIMVLGRRPQPSEAAHTLLAELQALVESSGLQGRVALLFDIPRRNIPEVYRWVAKMKGLYVHPCVAEPFGLTLLEATAAGLPVVASDQGGPASIVPLLGNGILGNMADPHDLRVCIQRILEDLEDWQASAKRCLPTLQERFNWAAHVEKYIACMRDDGELRFQEQWGQSQTWELSPCPADREPSKSQPADEVSSPRMLLRSVPTDEFTAKHGKLQPREPSLPRPLLKSVPAEEAPVKNGHFQPWETTTARPLQQSVPANESCYKWLVKALRLPSWPCAEEASAGESNRLLQSVPAAKAPAEHCPLWLLKALQFSSSSVVTVILKFSIVFWEDLEVPVVTIAWLNAVSLIVLFSGSLSWSSLIDRTERVRWILAATQVASCVFAGVLMCGAVQANEGLLLVTTCVMVLFMSSIYSVIDAICLAILKANPEAGEGYGQQRAYNAAGCGATSVIVGLVMDRWGSNAMYPLYFMEVGVLLCLVVLVMPDIALNRVREPSRPGSPEVSKFFSPKSGFIFLHLVMYGLSMSLIEVYLPLFYVHIGAPRVFVGMSVGIMCASEVPVFHAMDKVLGVQLSATTVLTWCQVVLVFRCMLYALLPREIPVVFLFVEPLHGLNFAAMWSAVVLLAEQLAPKGHLATMQALTSGVYFLLSQSVGGIVWGHTLSEFGFDVAFYSCGAFTLAWCAMWLVGRAVVQL